MEAPSSYSASASSRTINGPNKPMVFSLCYLLDCLFLRVCFFLTLWKVNTLGSFQTNFMHIWRKIILKYLLPKMHIKKCLSLEEAERLVEDFVPPWSRSHIPFGLWDLLFHSQRGCWTIQRWFKFHPIWCTHTECQHSK